MVCEDNVEYYDGTTWIKCEGGKIVELNDKKFECDLLLHDLKKSYLDKSKEFNNDLNAVIKDLFKDRSGVFLYGGGSIWLYSLPFTKDAKTLILDIKDNGFYVTGPRSAPGQFFRQTHFYYDKISDEDVRDILGADPDVDEIIKWRDIQINNPVTIGYKDAGDNARSIDTCYLADRYFVDKVLVVDLTRQGGTCPY